jgi:hypothetical protein
MPGPVEPLLCIGEDFQSTDRLHTFLQEFYWSTLAKRQRGKSASGLGLRNGPAIYAENFSIRTFRTAVHFCRASLG